MSTDWAPGSLPVRDFLSMGVSLVGMQNVGSRANACYRVMFRLRMLNASGTSVRLLGRKWTMKDASGSTRIIEGEQVFNDTPVLRPGEVYSYGGYHDFPHRPVNMELRFFGTDQSHAPFISPPLVFPRHCFRRK